MTFYDRKFLRMLDLALDLSSGYFRLYCLLSASESHVLVKSSMT